VSGSPWPSSDVDGRVRKFERFPKIQLIDLDAAKNTGDNRALVASICTRLPEYPSHRECGSAGCLRPSVQIWRMVLSPSNSIAIKPGSVSR
jgi:hypothetical protein